LAQAKILLVDDSKTTLFMEEMILKTDYELVRASDGEEALEVAAAENPDLVLLDVVMPKMDGFEVCRRLREREQTKDTPIIMVTTRGEGENMEKGFANGCTDYIAKPFKSLELLTKVKNYLAR
jgi:DNA-binding response OmpR family regulator